jgi:hypothetical protein
MSDLIPMNVRYMQAKMPHPDDLYMFFANDMDANLPGGKQTPLYWLVLLKGHKMKVGIFFF